MRQDEDDVASELRKARLKAVEIKGLFGDTDIKLELFEDITQKPAVIWGDSIVGFGKYKYHYDSGQKGIWPVTGFSPRKQNLSIY